METEGTFGRECFSSALWGSLALPLGWTYFSGTLFSWSVRLACDSHGLLSKRVQRAFLRVSIPDGQVSAGSQAGTRLGRASVSCRWEHGQGEAS